jgi:hypothetical protein
MKQQKHPYSGNRATTRNIVAVSLKMGKMPVIKSVIKRLSSYSFQVFEILFQDNSK